MTDWVQARAQCSVELVFANLVSGIQSDVATMTEILTVKGYRSRITAEVNPDRVLVARSDPGPEIRQVEFIRGKGAIEVRIGGTRAHEAVPRFTPGGECRVFVKTSGGEMELCAALAVNIAGLVAAAAWLIFWHKHERRGQQRHPEPLPTPIRREDRPEIRGKAYGFHVGIAGSSHAPGAAASALLTCNLHLTNHQPTPTNIRSIKVDGSNLGRPVLITEVKITWPKSGAVTLLQGIETHVDVGMFVWFPGASREDLADIVWPRLQITVVDAFGGEHPL